jgi:hypothetical protein
MRWKLQYSLSSILWLTLCCALVLSSVLMYRRMEKAEWENGMLRASAGYLKIDDESRFHAVAIEAYEPLTWRWRVYVPAGHENLNIHVACGDISDEGISALSANPMAFVSREGEMVLNAAVRQDKDGQWFLHVTTRNDKLLDLQGGVARRDDVAPIPDSVIAALTQKSVGTQFDIFGRGTGGTASQKIDRPIVLLRYRFLGNGTGPADTSPGIVIWLEEKK